MACLHGAFALPSYVLAMMSDLTRWAIAQNWGAGAEGSFRSFMGMVMRTLNVNYNLSLLNRCHELLEYLGVAAPAASQ